MRIRFWKRLAGCIAINCALAAAADYQAGTGASGTVRAVALVDRHGNRALLAQGSPPIRLASADLVAVRLVRDVQIDRAAILLAGGSTEDLLAAIDQALRHLEPATISFDGKIVSITVEGQCRATFFPISFDGCRPGTAVKAPIRAAFQVVDLAHALQKRGETPPVWPVQAIGLGRQVTILGVGGDAPGDLYRSGGVIVVPFANDSATPAADSRVEAAVRQILRRIGR